MCIRRLLDDDWVSHFSRGSRVPSRLDLCTFFVSTLFSLSLVVFSSPSSVVTSFVFFHLNSSNSKQFFQPRWFQLTTLPFPSLFPAPPFPFLGWWSFVSAGCRTRDFRKLMNLIPNHWGFALSRMFLFYVLHSCTVLYFYRAWLTFFH